MKTCFYCVYHSTCFSSIYKWDKKGILELTCDNVGDKPRWYVWQCRDKWIKGNKGGCEKERKKQGVWKLKAVGGRKKVKQENFGGSN